MSVRARRRVPQEEHSGPDERWMASYMDMVTVLMCMFIVLFAMSTVDQEKFEALSASLATGFGQEPSDEIDATTGVVVPPELVDEKGEDFADVDLAAAQTEFDELGPAGAAASGPRRERARSRRHLHHRRARPRSAS